MKTLRCLETSGLENLRVSTSKDAFNVVRSGGLSHCFNDFELKNISHWINPRWIWRLNLIKFHQPLSSHSLTIYQSRSYTLSSLRESHGESICKIIREILILNYLVVRVSGYRHRGPGFDPRCYQIFWVVVGLERGPLSLVRSNWGATWIKKVAAPRSENRY